MKNRKLTDEEKARMAPLLRQTWEAIAPDCGEGLKVREIVEITCDADHPVINGRMSREDYNIMSEAYNHRDTQTWLRATLNY